MGLGVAKIQRIDHHADVGGILARLARVRDLDQFKGRFVHLRLEFFIAIPIAVSFLDHDAALHQQAFQHARDIEFRVLGIAHAERDVFEVAKQRKDQVVIVIGHAQAFRG